MGRHYKLEAKSNRNGRNQRTHDHNNHMIKQPRTQYGQHILQKTTASSMKPQQKDNPERDAGGCHYPINYKPAFKQAWQLTHTNTGCVIDDWLASPLTQDESGLIQMIKHLMGQNLVAKHVSDECDRLHIPGELF
ncbi:hypothetical protein RF11_04835 [Thelohanellus kitauei]|uniref:Uncharacterized protein n=1 Tax=Thelohanellus kitauei TaxID=669202 RepID=A0A0C2N5X8_THEKT|nr:hypothetical protein RF11_04835 [Thelohanellus kitauei]